MIFCGLSDILKRVTKTGIPLGDGAKKRAQRNRYRMDNNMSLLQNWRDIAYNQEADKKQLQQFWTNYFLIEKNIYEQLLSNPDEVVKEP